MNFSDIGIICEIGGFVLLLFTASRLANDKVLTLGKIKNKFDKFSEYIIKEKYVYTLFIFGIILVIFGLILQFSFFDNM